MRPLAKILVLTGFAAMTGCAAHAVRCDERLEAINAPRPKPTQGANPAPNADVAPPGTTPPSGP